jgi:hypothetical protein
MMNPEIMDHESVEDSASSSLLSLDPRSSASSTPPTSLSSAPSELSDATKPTEESEPRRSARDRKSVGTYNLATLVGTNVHTPTKYLKDKPRKRTVSGDTLVEQDTESKEKLLDDALDKDWTLGPLPGDSLPKRSPKKDISRKSSRLGLIKDATSNAFQAASSVLGKRTRDAFESSKSALKTITGKDRPSSRASGSSSTNANGRSTKRLRAEDSTPVPIVPAEERKPRKLWLKAGLYQGQQRPLDGRPNESRTKSKTTKRGDTQVDTKKESFPPLPMFKGARLLEEGWRPYLLPFDVLNPLPKAVKKPEGWANLSKSKSPAHNNIDLAF